MKPRSRTGRQAQMLQDPGGTPADRLTGRPLDVSHFLRIAIPLAGRSAMCMSMALFIRTSANILVDAADAVVGMH
jgi:hypothetical protein